MLNLRCQQCWLHHKTICFGFFQSWFTDFWMKGHQLFTSCLTRKHHSYPTIHHLQPSSSLSANIIHTYTTNWWEEAYHRNLTANTSSLTHPSSLCNPFFFSLSPQQKHTVNFIREKKENNFHPLESKTPKWSFTPISPPLHDKPVTTPTLNSSPLWPIHQPPIHPFATQPHGHIYHPSATIYLRPIPPPSSSIFMTKHFPSSPNLHLHTIIKSPLLPPCLSFPRLTSKSIQISHTTTE